ALGNDHVEQPERQGGIGSGCDRQVLVRPLRGTRADRIDDDQLGTVALRLGDEPPDMIVAGERVGSPHPNQTGAVHRLWIETMAPAHGVAGAEAASMMTDRRFMDRGANRVPETLPDAVEALEMPHATAAGVGPDGLATVGRDHLAQAVGELGKRGVPCGALEPTGALGADAAH